MNVTITLKLTQRIFLLLIAVLFFANLLVHLYRLHDDTYISRGLFRLFDLNTEANIPTLFSTLLLLSSSLLLLFIHYSKNTAANLFGHWSILSVVFLFLAFDENAAIHESLVGIFRRNFNLTVYLYYSWILPYGFLMVVAGIFYYPFLKKLPRRPRIEFCISGGIFLTGAIGLELFEGRHDFIIGTDDVF